MYCWYGSNSPVTSFTIFDSSDFKVIHHFLLTHNCLKAFQFCANRRALKYREGMHSGAAPDPSYRRPETTEKSASWHSPPWTSSLRSWTRRLRCWAPASLPLDSEAAVLSSSSLPLDSEAAVVGRQGCVGIRLQPRDEQVPVPAGSGQPLYAAHAFQRVALGLHRPHGDRVGARAGVLHCFHSSSSSGPWLAFHHRPSCSTNRAGQKWRRLGATNSEVLLSGDFFSRVPG